MRSKYQELQNKYRHDPRKFQTDEKTDDNPLSQDETVGLLKNFQFFIYASSSLSLSRAIGINISPTMNCNHE